MATKKYLSLDRLAEYDALLKAKIATDDEVVLNSAKDYTDDEISKITSGATVVPEAAHAAAADAAAKLATGRTISLTGDASGSVSFDGSNDVSITVTVADDSHNHIIDNIDGLQSALDGKAAAGHNHDDRYYTESEMDTKLAGKSDSTHKHDDLYDAKGAAAAAETAAKAHADSAASKVKNDLLNGAGAAYDTLKELGDLIVENGDAIESLNQIAAGKADAGHKHTVADITDLTATATELNYMDGVTSSVQAQLDGKVAKVSGKGLSTNDLTDALKGNYDAAYTHSQAVHAPSNAQANVIESVKVNGTALTISSKAVNITVPTKVSDLTNDSKYLVAADIANKADKATTLAGYGITDAYTKSEVYTQTQTNTAISNAIDAVECSVADIENLFK